MEPTGAAPATTTGAPAAGAAPAPTGGTPGGAPAAAPSAIPAAGGEGNGTQGAVGAPGADPAQEQFTDRERAFLTATQEERDKRQAIETRAAELEQTLSLLRNQAPQQQQAGPAQPADPFSGIDDESILTGADVKNLFKTGIMPMLQQIAGAVALTQRTQQYGNPAEVAPFIQQAIQKDPALGQAIQAVPPQARAIILHGLGLLAKQAYGGQQQAAMPGGGIPPTTLPAGPGGTMDLNALAMQILQNAQRPAPAGAGGSMSLQDMATQVLSMTDAQIMARAKELQQKR